MNIKISQDMGLDLGGLGGGDAGGLGALPMADPAGGAMGGGEAPAAPVNQFKVIYSPLDGIGKILADLDLKSYLQNNFDKTPEEIAHNIWVMYGGGINELTSGKKGKRIINPYSDDPNVQQQQSEKEYNNTRARRWERLPSGVSIDEITTPQAIRNAVINGFHQLSRQNSKPAQANSLSEFIKAANAADEEHKFFVADKLDYVLLNVYSSR